MTDALYMTLSMFTNTAVGEVHPLSYSGRLFCSFLMLYSFSLILCGFAAVARIMSARSTPVSPDRIGTYRMAGGCFRNVLAVGSGIIFLTLGAAGFRVIEGWPVFDGLYMSLSVMVHTVFGEIHPLSAAGRVFNSFQCLFGLGMSPYYIYAATLAVSPRGRREDLHPDCWHGNSPSVRADSNTTYVCYAREDADFELKLGELRAAGVKLWFDQFDIAPGGRWVQAVEEALKSCGRFMVILSLASVESHHVLDEVSFALDEGKQIVPVLFQPCTPPFRLRYIQYLDLTGGYQTGFWELLQALEVRPEPAAG